jgi:hypothetical protein
MEKLYQESRQVEQEQDKQAAEIEKQIDQLDPSSREKSPNK